MFLDRCDICHKPRQCRGYLNMILCDECLAKDKEKQSYIDIKKIDHNQKQMTLDDFLRK